VRVLRVVRKSAAHLFARVQELVMLEHKRTTRERLYVGVRAALPRVGAIHTPKTRRPAEGWVEALL
jgi:hypothetical protein